MMNFTDEELFPGGYINICLNFTSQSFNQMTLKINHGGLRQNKVTNLSISNGLAELPFVMFCHL